MYQVAGEECYMIQKRCMDMGYYGDEECNILFPRLKPCHEELQEWKLECFGRK